MKTFIILTLAMLSGCSWFHSRTPPAPTPVFIVTGAPAGSVIFIDDAQAGQTAEFNDRPQTVSSVEGMHKVEVRFGDAIVYRENIYIKAGERRVVTVLSGSNRE